MALASGPLCDHLTSTAITANASGARVTELRYYAYGGTRYDAGGQLTIYRYTGQRVEGHRPVPGPGHHRAGAGQLPGAIHEYKARMHE